MISVCIATYNGEKYIKEQLDSILYQLGAEDEIIISDDESTDKTIEIINRYNDNRIKILHHKKDKELLLLHAASFRLVSQNFENAINHANGDFIYLSDQDDVWLSDKITNMQRELQNHDVVMCNYKVIDNKNNIINEKFFTQNPISKSLLINMWRTPFLGCCMAFKRSVLDYCLPFPDKCIGHDFWIGCLTVHEGSFAFIEKPLHLYRKHVNNVSPATSKSKNPLWFKISYRFLFYYQVDSYSRKYKRKKK